MMSAYDLKQPPVIVPVLDAKQERIALKRQQLRKHFIDMIAGDPSQSYPMHLDMENKAPLADALEQFSSDEIAQFILEVVYILKSENESLDSDNARLESELYDLKHEGRG